MKGGEGEVGEVGVRGEIEGKGDGVGYMVRRRRKKGGWGGGGKGRDGGKVK